MIIDVEKNKQRFDITTYPNACQIKMNNKRLELINEGQNKFYINLINHGEKWNEKSKVSDTIYLGRNTCVTQITLTTETLFALHTAICKVLKLSNFIEK